MKIFFSVIIPMYNSQLTIKRALNSISLQTYDGIIETIIVDDGSKDNSVQVVRDYIVKYSTKNRIFKLLIQENLGPSSARNKGIIVASGDYIALLDSDDFFHQKKFDVLKKYFNIFKDVSVIGHSYSVGTSDVSFKSEIDIVNIKKKNFYQILVKNFAATPCVTFKKSCNMLFNESMKFTEDHDFFLRLSYKNCNFLYLDVPLTHLNREILSTGGLSQNKLKMRIGEIKMYANLYKLNKLFIILTLPLILLSILKHIIKLGKN